MNRYDIANWIFAILLLVVVLVLFAALPAVQVAVTP